MSNQQELSIPAHLEELLQPTPSGTAKLLAAWDGLSPENHILLLTAKVRRPAATHLHFRIIEKALKSENAYVRYLAAKGCYRSADAEQERALKEQVAKDTDPLVRHASLESDFGAFDLGREPINV